MTGLSSLSILLFIAGLSSWLNHRFIRLPSAIGIMMVSLLFSLVMIILGLLRLVDISVAQAFVGNLDFEALLLHGMLAFLLFAGGLTVEFSALSAQKGIIGVLSTFGVLTSTFILGFSFWLGHRFCGVDLPFEVALLFGAICSPTDAVGALGILRKVGVPKSLETTVVGESLFNDGFGVVIFLSMYSVVYGIHGHDISFGHIGLTLIGEVFGGACLGLLLGWITYLMLKSVDEYVVELLLTLALAAGSYSFAEALHVSAPICVVVAGLIIGNHGRAYAMTEITRSHLDTFWELIDEVLNAILFMLIGVEIVMLSINASLLYAGLLAIVALMLSRLLSIWLTVVCMRRYRTFDSHVIKILTWGGLRGGISVALALSLPHGGHRDLLVVSTYIVVLFSVLVQGSTLPLLLRMTKE